MQDEDDLRQTLPPPPSATGDNGELPYQPRVRRTRGGQDDQGDLNMRYQAQRGGENPPGMLAFEDKIEKYAEGTFLTIHLPTPWKCIRPIHDPDGMM